MTGPDDDLTATLARTLRRRAEEAPSADGLTDKALALVARRRRRRLHASIAAIVVLAVGIPVTIMTTIDRGTVPAATQPGPTWRWESYRAVQVQVPPDWGHGVPGAWCIGQPESKRPGAVGRPGHVPAILCPSDYPPVSERESWFSFDTENQVGVRGLDHGWIEETRRVNGMSVTLFTNDDALRAAVLGSVQPIAGADRNGCPPDHAVVADPDGHRPDPAGGGLPPADAVESISVCRYELAGDSAPPLLSSSRIPGAGAKELVAAIGSAPAGGGPDVGNAGPDSDDSEIIVLRVHTADGAREVVVRYSGQSGNGFDDGIAKHVLTADSVRPLLTGAHSPESMYPPVAGLLGH